MKTRKTGKQKLHNTKKFPKLVRATMKIASRRHLKSRDAIVVLSPLEVDALVKKLTYKKLTTGQKTGTAIAHKHKTATCPITTGIFVRIAAEAAKESRQEGEKNYTGLLNTNTKCLYQS